MAVTIPKGKKVTFSNITGFFHLEEELTITVNTTYKSIFDGIAGKAGDVATILGSISTGLFNTSFSGKFKQMGGQIWDNTDPLQISFTCGAYMGESETSVKNRALQLLNLTVPESGSNFDNLKPPGPTIIDILEGDIEQTSTTQTGRRVTINIGNFNFTNMIITKVEPTFNQEVDSKGNPISVKIRVDASTIVSAYTGLINKI